MTEWRYAQLNPAEELAELSFYTFKKIEEGREIEFRITMREYVTVPPGHHSRYFAEADKHVNQKTAAVLPSGWGDSPRKALADCLRMIRSFPYEGE